MKSFVFRPADRVTVGSVGEPGKRTFYLQARHGVEVASVKLEKQQVAAMAQYLHELLADLPETTAEEASAVDTSFDEPDQPDWVLRAMQLSYDHDEDEIVILGEEIPAEEEPGELSTGMIGMTRSQARSLVAQSIEVLSGGRPTCPLCGFPLDPEGHSCPATNGHGPPSL